MRFLQRRPSLLELVYRFAAAILRRASPLLRQGGVGEWFMVRAERVTKGPIFDCRMCGQCVLHTTGMTCPMTCPKNLRNGPCGGVSVDGRCEVKPEMVCVWVQAWERSRKMPVYGATFVEFTPPLDRSLAGTSAWVNEVSGRSARLPAAWRN